MRTFWGLCFVFATGAAMTAQEDNGRILVKFSQGDSVLNALSEAPQASKTKAAPTPKGTILKDSLALAKNMSGFALQFDPNDVFVKAAASAKKAPDGALDSPGGGFSEGQRTLDAGGGSGETMAMKEEADAAAKGVVLSPNSIEDKNARNTADLKPMAGADSEPTPSQMEKAVENSENYEVAETPELKAPVEIAPIPGTPAAAPTDIKRSAPVANTIKEYLPTAAMLGYQYFVRKKQSSDNSSSNSETTESSANIQPTGTTLSDTNVKGSTSSTPIVRPGQTASMTPGGEVLDSEALRPRCATEPVPEPFSLAALAIGGLALFGRRKMKK